MFAALVDIDTSLSLVQSLRLYRRASTKGSREEFPLGKGIFQFKYGLFIELLRQG